MTHQIYVNTDSSILGLVIHDNYIYKEFDNMRKDNIVYGRRAVAELFDSGLTVKRLLIKDGLMSSSISELENKAKSIGIEIERRSRHELDRLTGSSVHQGVVAYYSAPDEYGLEDVLNLKLETALILILDGIEDPHNFGAVIRSAEVFGAKAVIFPQNHSASLSPTVVKTSAGAALRLPIVRVVNLVQTVKILKDNGYWLFGLDPKGNKNIWETDIRGKTALVFGSEGKGLSRLIKEKCDFLIHIPQTGSIASLNVSASAAIVMAEWTRQKQLTSVGIEE